MIELAAFPQPQLPLERFADARIATATAVAAVTAVTVRSVAAPPVAMLAS